MTTPTKLQITPDNLPKTCRPREVPKEYVQIKQINKKQWCIEISLFKDYKFDNEDLLRKCFEYDWNSSKIPKLIKDEEQLKTSKEILRKSYKFLKASYKYYSGISTFSRVPCISVNVFTDFSSEVDLIDG